MRLSPARRAASTPSDSVASTMPMEAKNERPIDLVHLTRQTFGEKRLETELLRLFAHQSEQVLASLEGSGPGRFDGQLPADLLHILLGSARAVGATLVARLAQQLEAERRHARGAERDLPEEDRARLRDAVVRTNRFIAGLLEAT